MMRLIPGLWAVAALGLTVIGMAQTLPSPQSLPVLPEVSPTSPAPVPVAVPSTQPQSANVSSFPVSTAPVVPIVPEANSATLQKEVVNANLDQQRQQIAPALGGEVYIMGPSQIQSVPEGDNAPFQQVLLRMPGVVEDSFGQEHIRGEHADFSYRVNGVILPEPLNGFGQELDTHLIDSVSLIDGSLPAQFGFRTAGIVDVSTKAGSSLQSNEISLYGGTYDTVNPSFEIGGSSGKWDYFVTGSYKQDSLGIENPEPDRDASHDNTDQSRMFSYLSYHIDDTSRLSFLINASDADFQIPDVTGEAPQFDVNGLTTGDSRLINENQNEQTYYGVMAYQKSAEDFSMQASTYFSYGQIHYQPDTTNDLLFQGVAGDIFNNFVAEGLQVDAEYNLATDHTLRFGGQADYTVERDNTSTWVFPVDPVSGLQTTDVPSDIVDDTRNHATQAGVYLQDEWRLTKRLTLNYGLRFDEFDSNFDNEGQVSPRVNLVWKATDKVEMHAGYSRYFDPPPIQNVPSSTVAKFFNTTNAAPNLIDDPPKVERSNYYDIGVARQMNQAWRVSVDGYFKEAHNLVDLGQFGNALILSPFNYQEGFDYGGEFSTNYKSGPLSGFFNFAYNDTGGKNIDSQQFLIDNAELAYIQNNFIHLDHQGTYTASLGGSWQISDDDMVYVDALYGSGLRTGFANTGVEPQYFPVNLGYEHHFELGGTSRDMVKVRFDVLNVLDESYQLRSGTGIGVSAPQYGQRRTFYMGVAYDF